MIDEIDVLNSDITGIDNDLQDNLELQETINWQINISKTNVVSFYNSLDSTSKILLDPNVSSTQKYNETAGIVSNIQASRTVTLKTAQSYSTANYDSLPNTWWITTWKEALTRRANTILAEIEPLKIDRDNKKIIYDEKYADYLAMKELYEEDQRLKTYWNDRYYEYRDKYNDLNDEYELNKRRTDLYSDAYLQEIDKFPDSSNYPVSTFERSSYANKMVHMEQFDFTYRWNQLEISFRYSSQWWFPGRLYIHYKWWNAIYTRSMNSAHQISDSIWNMENYAKYRIDHLYYRDLVQDIENSWNLTNYANIRDDADAERLLYWLLDYLEIDHYEQEETEYLQAKQSYENAVALLQTKLNALEVVKQKLSTYWIKLADVIDNENNLAITITEESSLNDTQIALWTTLDNKQDELIAHEASNPEIENQNQINNRLELLNFDYESPYALDTVSQNFAQYPWAYMEFKNGYTGVIKNRNWIIFQWTQEEIDNQKYLDFPYTTYIKFNNEWTWNDYPALLWIEYKKNATDEIPYSTQRIELNSRADLNSWVISDLAKKVEADIDLRRNGMGDSVDEEYYNNALNWSEWSNYALLEALKNRWIELNIENLKALWASSWEFLLWMKDWALQLWEDSITELIETPETIWNIVEWTAMSFAKWFELTWKWMAVWVALANKSFRNDYVWDKVLENALADIEVEWIEVNRQINEFIDSAEELLELAKYAYANLDKIENSEYYGWYITWYIDAIIAEWIALTIATRNWKVAWQTVKNGKSFIKISQLLYKFRVAWEIFKITFNKVNFDLLSKLDKVEVEKYEILIKQSITILSLSKQKRYLDRMNKMDDFMYKQYVNNPQKYIDNFEVGGKYNMLLEKDTIADGWKKWDLEYINWKIRYNNGFTFSSWEKVDFVVINWELKFWKYHSFISNWENVDYAWILHFGKNNQPNRWSNRSGHYKPDLDDIDGKNKFLDLFDDKFNEVWIKNIEFKPDINSL